MSSLKHKHSKRQEKGERSLQGLQSELILLYQTEDIQQPALLTGQTAECRTLEGKTVN